MGDHPVHPEEAALIQRAAPRRIATFAAGRVAARAALAAGGCTDVGPILWQGRVPRPPEGWRLSITHTDTQAAAIACRAELYAGLGVDIEDISRIEPGMARFIARPDDRLPDASPATLATAFSLREAIFKALDADQQKALTRIDLGWDGRLRAALIPALPAHLQYETTTAGGLVASLCVRHV